MAIVDVLQHIGEKFAGFRCVVLIGKDGLIVEKHGASDAALDELAVEFVNLRNKFEGLLDDRGDGPVVETVIRGNQVNFFMSSINDAYILFLGVSDEENVGRCRFELQKASLDLRRELAE